MNKDFFDGGEIRIKIKMLFLDIQDEAVLRMEAAQGAIAFVTFGDEIFAARVPVRVRSENWNFGAHVIRRMQFTFAQDVSCHC